VLPEELCSLCSLLGTPLVMASAATAEGDTLKARLAAIAIPVCVDAPAFGCSHLCAVACSVNVLTPQSFWVSGHQQQPITRDRPPHGGVPNAIDRLAITDIELDDGAGDGETLGDGLGDGDALGKGIGDGCCCAMTLPRGNGAIELVGHAMSDSMASETIATSRTNIKNLSMRILRE
jgi:hypothetical protein